MSGLPGRVFTFNLNRYPMLWSMERTAFSGAVFRLPIRDIILERSSRETMSVTGRSY